MKENIMVKIKEDKIMIKLPEEKSHSEIMALLEKRIKDLKKLYKDEKTPIYIEGKVLKNKEIDEIYNLVKRYIDVEITFETSKELGLHTIKKVFESNLEISETKFIKGNIRSGNKVQYEGSIVILGDVSPGAEVIAGENIIVLGNLRGVAHARSKRKCKSNNCGKQNT